MQNKLAASTEVMLALIYRNRLSLIKRIDSFTLFVAVRDIT